VIHPIRLSMIVSAGLLALAACSKPSEPAPAPAEPAPATPAPAPAPAPAAEVISSEGFGAVKIGMTEQEVINVLGAGAKPAVGAGEPNGCHHVYSPKDPGLAVMIENGKATRVTAQRNSTAKSDKGVGLGATAEQVQAAYGSTPLESEPHKYEAAPAKYLTAWTVKGQSGVRYVINSQGVVANIHGGGPSILYVEGCS
jgi:hypothetical protein